MAARLMRGCIPSLRSSISAELHRPGHVAVKARLAWSHAFADPEIRKQSPTMTDGRQVD
jgi:hypothetical protein